VFYFFSHRHLAFNFPLCKLYTNSLLSSLNARTPQGAAGSGRSGDSGQVVFKRLSVPTPPPHGVFIDVESVTRVSSGLSDVSGALVQMRVVV